jgi:tetraacyldisaccharide 4'-kinase
VISVGNLTVGGTGKTPMVAALCKMLLSAGTRPAIVTRGYGGTVGRGPLVVEPGDGRTCPGPDRIGDEPALLARTLPGVTVVVGSDRVAGAREAIARGAGVVVLDDGFQHRRLARDVDIVLIDATDPFGGGRLLPAGRLREPPGSLARADLVVLTRCSPDPSGTTIVEAVRQIHPDVPIVRARQRAVGFVDRSGREVPAPTRAIAFCGIGNPAAFERDLRAAGVEVGRFEAFRDHRPYTSGDLAGLIADAHDRSTALVTTEKDLVRLDRADAPDPGPIVALRIETVLDDPGPLVALLRTAGALR